MENIIKNFNRLSSVLTPEQQEKVEYSAFMHRRYSRIFFKVVRVDADSRVIAIQVSQEKSPHENYADGKRLVEIVEETFRPFFDGWQIQKITVPYQSAPPEVVTPEWIRAQMTKLHIGNKKLMADLGIAPAEISALINGHREMGIRTKAMFYYYFKAQEANHD